MRLNNHSDAQTQPATKHSRRFYRLDSWLSEADANFLLSKKALWEASKGNYPTAIELFDRLIAFESETAEHYVNRGLVCARSRLWERAMTDYDRAIELDSTLDKAYSNRANLQARNEDWVEAIADYDKAIDLNPLNSRARLNQAITFRQMGNYEEALTCLDIALFFQLDSAALLAERGRVYHLLGDWNCAIADYQTSLELIETNNSQSSHAKVARRVQRWMTSLRQA